MTRLFRLIKTCPIQKNKTAKSNYFVLKKKIHSKGAECEPTVMIELILVWIGIYYDTPDTPLHFSSCTALMIAKAHFLQEISPTLLFVNIHRRSKGKIFHQWVNRHHW